jgi:hypothetical protein
VWATVRHRRLLSLRQHRPHVPGRFGPPLWVVREALDDDNEVGERGLGLGLAALDPRLDVLQAVVVDDAGVGSS